jgi:hypothetical protein
MTCRSERIVGFEAIKHILLFVACCPIPAWAHHSGAMFDRSKTVQLQGTVKEFIYSNPHCWIRLYVTNPQGEVQLWEVEGSPPVRFAKWGVTPEVLKAGDKVTVNMHPIRDGRNAGSFVSIKLANGKFLDSNADVNSYVK